MFQLNQHPCGYPMHGESNRVRTVTSDSITYTSSESSMCSGNRSRSNTSDSLSSSDNSTSVTLGPDGKPLQGARRRSHRPRGCRGGRKNRKNKERQRVQPSTVPPEQPISHKESFSSVPQTLHLGMEFEPTLPAPSRFNSDACPSPSVALMPPPARLQPRVDLSTSLFRPIVENSNTATLSTATSFSSSTSSHGYGEWTPSEILPPAPPLSSNSPETLPGPNPYALRNGVFRNSATTGVHHMPSTASFLPSVSTCVSLDDEMATTNVRQPTSSCNSTNDRAGGSLFATSPRSFLLGGKTSW